MNTRLESVPQRDSLSALTSNDSLELFEKLAQTPLFSLPAADSTIPAAPVFPEVPETPEFAEGGFKDETDSEAGSVPLDEAAGAVPVEDSADDLANYAKTECEDNGEDSVLESTETAAEEDPAENNLQDVETVPVEDSEAVLGDNSTPGSEAGVEAPSAPEIPATPVAIAGLTEHIVAARSFLNPLLTSDSACLLRASGEERLIDPQIFAEAQVPLVESLEADSVDASDADIAEASASDSGEDSSSLWSRVKGKFARVQADDATAADSVEEIDLGEEAEAVVPAETRPISEVEFQKIAPKWQTPDEEFAPVPIEVKEPEASTKKTRKSDDLTVRDSQAKPRKLEYPYTTTGMIREVTEEDLRAQEADSFFDHFDHDRDPLTSPLPIAKYTDDDVTGRNDVEIKPLKDSGKRLTSGTVLWISFSILLVVGLIVSMLVLLKPLRQEDAADLRKSYASQAQMPTSIDTKDALPIDKVSIISNDVDQNENQAKYLFDEDVKTALTSKSYRASNLEELNLDPIGFRVNLKEPAKVKKVTIYTASAGGKFQVFVNSPEGLPESKPVTEGEFTSPETTITFPGDTEVKNFVIVIRKLPVEHSSRIRAYINEVVVH